MPTRKVKPVTRVDEAKVAPDRVQGHTSDLDDLVLANTDESVIFTIGGGIVPTPTLKRTTGGGSTITIEVRDESMDLLDIALFGEEDWRAELDGLDFTYLGMKKAGTLFTLALEESAIAALRKLKGPKKVQARRGKTDEVTRAEFIVSLIEEAEPAIPYFCPQLHETQPIRTEQEGKKAKADAKANREKGIGDAGNLTVKGVKATPDQVDVMDRALRTAASHKAPREVVMALIEALAVESVAGDFANLLGMTPETEAASKYSATVVEEACAGFLLGYVSGHEGALLVYRKNPGMKPYEIAQAVQKSGAGKATNGKGNYGEWESEAAEWADSYDGTSAGTGGSVTTTQAYYFEVGKDEDYWTAIKRLAKEVNWRAFFVANRFFYIDEYELARGMVRLAIERERGASEPLTAGIEDVDFDFNGNKPITTITITAFAKEWSVPPGAVITLQGYGPASKGFGDPPPKVGEKKRRIGLSANKNVDTGEGRARYIVDSIEGALTGDAETRLLTIKAHKPTKPLGEPPNATKTTDTGSSETDAAGDASKMIEWAKATLGTNEGSARHAKWANAAGVSTGAPWCSVWISYGLTEICGLPVPSNPAYSGTWMEWGGGTKVSKNDIQPGDILIFDWGDGGITDHVALAIGGGRLIGGNQSNSVTEDSINMDALVAVIRPNYRG